MRPLPVLTSDRFEPSASITKIWSAVSPARVAWKISRFSSNDQ